MPEAIEPIERERMATRAKPHRTHRSFFVDPDVHHRLKIMSVQLGMSVSDVLNIALNDWLNSEIYRLPDGKPRR